LTDPFIRAQLGKLDDFWRRRMATQTSDVQFHAFGHPVHFAANDPRLLTAGRLSAARYSRSDSVEPTVEFRVAVDSKLGDEPVPADWPPRLRCTALGRWLMVNCDPWVNACADLDSWSAAALVSPSLADEPHYLSRYVCDRFLLNLVMGEGLGRLHAACVWRDGTAILLSGPGGSGKSATALRLALAGYRAVSDGMIHVRVGTGRPELLAYPVGEAKLCQDTLEWFPELSGGVGATLGGEQAKVVLDLRKVGSIEVAEGSVRPDAVVVAHLVRTGNRRTSATRIGAQEMLERVWPESSFVEDERVMGGNLAALRRLLAAARCYVLELGSDPAALLAAVETL
jgi:hypothetical protein